MEAKSLIPELIKPNLLNLSNKPDDSHIYVRELKSGETRYRVRMMYKRVNYSNGSFSCIKAARVARDEMVARVVKA